MTHAGSPSGNAAQSARPARGWSAWPGVLRSADRAIFALVLARRTERSVAMARWVSGLAEPRVVYPGVGLAGLLSVRRTGWRGALAPCLVVGSGAVARHLVCRGIARPRPPSEAWLTEPSGFSLPSRHVTMAALAAGSVSRALGVPSMPRRVGPLVAAAAVGGSRVCLGVHWPGDALTGLIFAEAWLRFTDAVRRHSTCYQQ